MKELLISAVTSSVSSFTQHPNRRSAVFLKCPVWFLYKALSFLRALIILGIKVLMFNHRQATGHEPTVALRQQSARSTRGTLVHSRVCGKLQDKQGKGGREREERERTAGCVAFKYLSDYLDTHRQIVLNFKATDMDIK